RLENVFLQGSRAVIVQSKLSVGSTNCWRDPTIDIGGALDLTRSTKRAASQISRQGCSCTEQQPECNASSEDRQRLLEVLVQRRRCPSNDTGILNRDRLRLEVTHLVVFLERAVVQSPERVGRTLEVAQREPSLTIRPRLSN